MEGAHTQREGRASRPWLAWGCIQARQLRETENAVHSATHPLRRCGCVSRSKTNSCWRPLCLPLGIHTGPRTRDHSRTAQRHLSFVSRSLMRGERPEGNWQGRAGQEQQTEGWLGWSWTKFGHAGRPGTQSMTSPSNSSALPCPGRAWASPAGLSTSACGAALRTNLRLGQPLALPCLPLASVRRGGRRLRFPLSPFAAAPTPSIFQLTFHPP